MTHCRLCKHPSLEPLLNLGCHPMSHHFLDGKTDQSYTHIVDLQLCPECGLSQLVTPCPEEHLYTNYVTLSAWKQHPQTPQILEILRKEAHLSAATKVVEVGSNDGSFLQVLKKHGISEVIGIEPANDAQKAAKESGIPTFGGFLNSRTADAFVRQHGKADLLICRHVAEHILELEDFAASVAKLLNPGAHVYFEVPDCEFFFRSLDYSAIWEQHTNYFSYATLERFLGLIGVEVSSVHSFLFSGIVFGMVGRFTGDVVAKPYRSGKLEELKEVAHNYGRRFEEFQKLTHDFLKQAKSAGKRIAAYGAGSRTTSFINFLGIGEYLEFIADDQPGKQGRYLPGARIPIVPSALLASEGIDVCLVGVTTECEEAALKPFLSNPNNKIEFYSVNPPSNRLLPVWRKMLGTNEPVIRSDNYQGVL
jgi:hypothetical protein